MLGIKLLRRRERRLQRPLRSNSLRTIAAVSVLVLSGTLTGATVTAVIRSHRSAYRCGLLLQTVCLSVGLSRS